MQDAVAGLTALSALTRLTKLAAPCERALATPLYRAVATIRSLIDIDVLCTGTLDDAALAHLAAALPGVKTLKIDISHRRLTCGQVSGRQTSHCYMFPLPGPAHHCAHSFLLDLHLLAASCLRTLP